MAEWIRWRRCCFCVVNVLLLMWYLLLFGVVVIMMSMAKFVGVSGVVAESMDDVMWPAALV